jgi:hypothetical protein
MKHDGRVRLFGKGGISHECAVLEDSPSRALEGVADCYRKALLWAKLYYATRGSLIVFSALTSAAALGAAPAVLGPHLANDEYAHLRQKLLWWIR